MSAWLLKHQPMLNMSNLILILTDVLKFMLVPMQYPHNICALKEALVEKLIHANPSEFQ